MTNKSNFSVSDPDPVSARVGELSEPGKRSLSCTVPVPQLLTQLYSTRPYTTMYVW
jgi:hypothetical protein